MKLRINAEVEILNDKTESAESSEPKGNQLGYAFTWLKGWKSNKANAFNEIMDFVESVKDSDEGREFINDLKAAMDSNES